MICFKCIFAISLLENSAAIVKRSPYVCDEFNVPMKWNMCEIESSLSICISYVSAYIEASHRQIDCERASPHVSFDLASKKFFVRKTES